MDVIRFGALASFLPDKSHQPGYGVLLGRVRQSIAILDQLPEPGKLMSLEPIGSIRILETAVADIRQTAAPRQRSRIEIK